MEDKNLKHYGVVGMKWGVRKRVGAYKKFSASTRLSMAKSVISLVAPKKLDTLSDEQIQKGADIFNAIAITASAIQLAGLAAEYYKY